MSEEKIGKVKIYALIDIRDDTIFYVGRSIHPNNRLLQHLAEAEKFEREHVHDLERMFGIKSFRNQPPTSRDGSNIAKIKKILALKSEDLKPRMVILDHWDAPTVQDANRLEDAWIAEVRRHNHPLTNYIYSHRMNPWWYGKQNKYWKEGWAETPLEYIAMLKAGKLGDAKEIEGEVAAYTKPMTRMQRKRFAHRNRDKRPSKKKP